jgi:predicted DNA-binding protein (UPF0251 family)
MSIERSTRRDRENKPDTSIQTPPEHERFIPSSIFSTELSSYETTVKFLKEGYGCGLQQIAEILGKSRQSVWRAYTTASEKRPQSIEVTDLYYPIPASALKDTRLSILESLVVFLIEQYNLTYSQVSALIRRDDRTVWTAYQRAQKKKHASRKH